MPAYRGGSGGGGGGGVFFYSLFPTIKPAAMKRIREGKDEARCIISVAENLYFTNNHHLLLINIKATKS